MKSKTVLGILLLLSMVFLLYPSVTSLIDIQKAIGEASRYGYGDVDLALISSRDNLVLQIVGFVFLYIVLAFGFNFIRFEQQQTLTEPQQDNPTRSQQIIEKPKPKTPRVVKPLTNKTKNMIIILFASVFMLVFVWQVFGNMSALATTSIDSTMFVMEQAVKAIIASLSTGIIVYLIAKYVTVEHD